MIRPFVLRLGGGRDACVIVRAHVADAVGHPLDVLLDAARHVAERRAVVRPHQGEQVRKAGDLQAQIGARAVGPFVLERLPAHPADVDPVEGAGDRVEARRVDQDVELVLGSAGPDALGRNAFERRLVEIDQQDVGPVVGFIIAALQRHALGAERVVLGHQLFGDRGVVNACADFIAHELGERGVGVQVGHDVAEVTQPFPEAGLRP